MSETIAQDTIVKEAKENKPIIQAPKTEDELIQERMQDIYSLYNAQLYKPLFGLPNSQKVPDEVVFAEIILGPLGLAANQHAFNILPSNTIEFFADRIRSAKNQYLKNIEVEEKQINAEKIANLVKQVDQEKLSESQKSEAIEKIKSNEGRIIESKKNSMELKFVVIEAKLKGFSIETDTQKLRLSNEERDIVVASANEAMLSVYNNQPPIPFNEYSKEIVLRAEKTIEKNSNQNLKTEDMLRAIRSLKKIRDSEKSPDEPSVKALQKNKDQAIAATEKMCDVLVSALENPKDNTSLTARRVANDALDKAIGNREFIEGKSTSNNIKYIIFEHLIAMNPIDLETNKDKITKLCVQVINSNTKRLGFLGLFGDEVSFKKEGSQGIQDELKHSLEQFKQNPKPNVAKSDLLPAGMPAPVSEPMVDRAKVHVSNRVTLEPKPPLKPFPGKEAVKSKPGNVNKEKPELTPVVPFEKWEESELLPHGMPPREQKLTKPIPSVPQAVPIKPKSLAKAPDEPQKSEQSESPIQKAAPKAKRPVPKAIPLNKTSSAIVAPDKTQNKQDISSIKTDSVTEKPKTSSSAASKSSGENPILEAEKKQLKEIEGWKSGYKELGFTKRLGLSARPGNSNNLGQSLKEWREWYGENKTKLDEKKFAVPLEYKDMMSKLQIAQDLDKVIGKVYDEEDRIFARKIKDSNDDVARYTILQKEAENKRASRGINSKSVADIVRSDGGAQEHDSLRPPATKKSTKVEELNEKRRGSGSKSEGLGHS